MINILVRRISNLDDRKESLLVILSIICVFLIALFSILLTKSKNTNDLINVNKAISSKELSDTDNITYGFLKTIADDITNIDIDKLSISYLANELYYEPFLEHSSDNHKWYEFYHNNKVLFLGTKKNSCFALVIDKKNMEGKIYFSDTLCSTKDTNINDILNKNKFRLVNAYTGKDFRRGY